MAIEVYVLRNESREKIRQIGHHIRVGILLNHQRRGGVLAKNGQQSRLELMSLQPGGNLGRKIVQAFTAGGNVDLVGELLHSTVTLLARLRGWSTSHPKRTAM